MIHSTPVKMLVVFLVDKPNAINKVFLYVV